MKPFRHIIVIPIILLAVVAICPALRAEELNENDRQFLARYEMVRAALAADNLANAKASALSLGKEGEALARSGTIENARAAFSKLSARAISLARGRDGYYVVRCPMLKETWLQPAGTLSNPYAGQTMPECGMILK